MKIGIVGAGNIGGTSLANSWRRVTPSSLQDRRGRMTSASRQTRSAPSPLPRAGRIMVIGSVNGDLILVPDLPFMGSTKSSFEAMA
jgi:hypothetical protein